MVRLAHGRIEVPARLHPFVKDTHDFNNASPVRTIVDDVHGRSDRIGGPASARMPHVETSNARSQVASVPRQGAVRLGGELLYSVKQKRLVPLPRVNSPSFDTHGENVRKIGRRRSCEAKSRHGRQRSRGVPSRLR